jgi:hypothetical protein
MKLIKTASGKYKLTRRAWEKIGRQAGWIKTAYGRKLWTQEEVEELVAELAVDKTNVAIKAILDIIEAGPYQQQPNVEAALNAYVEETGADRGKLVEYLSKPSGFDTEEEDEMMGSFYIWVESVYSERILEEMKEDEELVEEAKEILYERRDPYGYRGLSERDFH